MYCVVGLGNPDGEYAKTRHNTGRLVLLHFLKKRCFPELVPSTKYCSLIAEREINGEKTLILWPETYMNNSGKAVAKAVKGAKAAQKLIVISDDLDLPLGTFKISYGRGSAGHRGVESIIKALKTKNFIRLRVGIMPTTPRGKPKKPKGAQRRYGGQNIIDFLLSDFKKPEQEILQKVSKRVNEALETLIVDGLEKAMNQFN